MSLFNLGFIQSTSDGKAGWGGYSVLAPGGTDSQAQSIDASIAALKAAGGDVMVSFGGAAASAWRNTLPRTGKPHSSWRTSCGRGRRLAA